MELLQQITSGDDTYMTAASPQQLHEVETRLKELVTTYDSTAKTLDGVSAILTDVLHHRDTDDYGIVESQMMTEMYIEQRLEAMACAGV